jgi:hypothetical protein
MKTAKVDVVTFKKEFTSQYGTLYSFEVKFNNGDTGLYNSKTKEQSKFIVGVDAEYELETKTNDRGSWNVIKPVVAQKPFSGGFGKAAPKNENSIIAQSSIKASVELVCAGIIEVKDLLPTADKIMNWVKEKGKQE